MKKALTILLILMAAGLLWAGSLMSAPGGVPGRPHIHPDGKYAEGELLVKFREGSGVTGRDRVRGKVGALGVTEYKGLGIQRIKVSPGLSVEEALEKLEGDPDVEYAEPNYVRRALWTPDDTLFGSLWGMGIIQAPAAWDIQNTCSPNIAVLDSGISNHVDLQGRVVFEYDFANEQALAYDDWLYYYDESGNMTSTQVQGHGTHVAGTIAAIANNAAGVAGVCASGANIMDLKILDYTGSGYISDEIQAINYATGKAKVLNMSIGGYNCSLSEQAALKSFGESGGLVVAAAGNEGYDNDTNPSFPASYYLPYVISVAATNLDNNLASFSLDGSNYGYFSTDLAAPGYDIRSTILNAADFKADSTAYALKKGTSMAAPHVTGVVGLVMTRFPGMSNIDVRRQVLGTVTKIAPDGYPANDLYGNIATGGILNASAAIANRVPASPAMLPAVVNSNVELSWTDNSDDETVFRVERMLVSESYFKFLDELAFNTTTFSDPTPAGGAYYRVMAVNTSIAGMELRSEPSEVVGANADTANLYTPPACTTPVPYSTGGGGGGCFIATAAYGTKISGELGTLRSFRDNVLGRSSAGKALVTLYYRNSPPLADTIKKSPALRAAVRGAIAPVVLALGHPLMSAALALLMAAALLMAGALRKGR